MRSSRWCPSSHQKEPLRMSREARNDSTSYNDPYAMPGPARLNQSRSTTKLNCSNIMDKISNRYQEASTKSQYLDRALTSFDSQICKQIKWGHQYKVKHPSGLSFNTRYSKMIEVALGDTVRLCRMEKTRQQFKKMWL